MSALVSSKNTHLRPPANQLGNLLRHWRNIRGKNQLDLSIETEPSQRHISFIESGRSVPSRQALMKIAQALDVPLRDRNVLLLSAGYAPAYSQAAWNSGQMQSVTRALELMDRYWNVLMTNESTAQEAFTLPPSLGGRAATEQWYWRILSFGVFRWSGRRVSFNY